jgi:His-Xaa-Ser system radical SAM maturase HxsC
MLNLGGKVVFLKKASVPRSPSRVFRIATHDHPYLEDAANCAYLINGHEPQAQYAVHLAFQVEQHRLNDFASGVVLSDEYRYLESGDIIRLEEDVSRIRVLYRRSSLHNNFLVTERCDNYCLMCSQPPKDIDDDWIIDEIRESIPLIDRSTKELGFTGGEPTLLGSKFLDVLRLCKDKLPETGIHVLSNGRRFSDQAFARDWADVQHPDLMVGIPVYADVSTVHDYVVQADGAYDQTIRGILNLKRYEQLVEIRVVLHKQTYARLPQLAEFLARNLLFVDHVALMGLEITCFTRANLDSLWIDPVEYQKQLYEAVQILDGSGLRTSIYNLPLCLLDRRLWKFAVQSISDWKNEYLPQCEECDVKNTCAGFFSSAKYKSSTHIQPIKLSD